MKPIDVPTICESLNELNYSEKYYIAYYNAVKDCNYYNIACGGDGGDVFSNLPDEDKIAFREKLSKALKGRKQSEEWINKRKRCGKSNGMYGKHLSNETKLKISKKVSGEKNGMYNVPSPMLGKHHSKDTIEKIRLSKLGENNPNWHKVYTDEERAAKHRQCSGDGNPRAIKCHLICLDTNEFKEFGNIKDALSSIGVSQGMYYYWKKSNKPIFSKITNKYYLISLKGKEMQ